MIDLQYIKNFYPKHIAENPAFDKHLVKEYVELMALDYLSNTQYIQKIAFIGGTNLRLIKGIDRFSEDLDFDCKDMNHGEFIKMSDSKETLISALNKKIDATDLDLKCKDFTHLLFNPSNANRIKLFREFINNK